MKFSVKAEYGDCDNDVVIFLQNFNVKEGALVLEVGANQEFASHILANHGYQVLGVDLQPFYSRPYPHYPRLEGDFCELVERGIIPKDTYDAVFSTSAIEHFGLGTYPQCPRKPDHDTTAMQAMYKILKPGGECYITVPYGKNFKQEGNHWRVYNQETLQERLIGKFQVVEKICFKSAECHVADNGGKPPIVTVADADNFADGSPHLTVFLRLRKPG